MIKQKSNKNKDWLWHPLIMDGEEIIGVDTKMIKVYIKTEDHEGHTFIFHQPEGWRRILVTELKTGGTVKKAKSIEVLELMFNDWKKRKSKVQIILCSIRCRKKLKNILEKCQKNQ